MSIYVLVDVYEGMNPIMPHKPETKKWISTLFIYDISVSGLPLKTFLITCKTAANVLLHQFPSVHIVFQFSTPIFIMI